MVLKETGKSPFLQLTNNFHGPWWRLQFSNSFLAVSVTPSCVRSPFFPPILHTACQSDLYQMYILFFFFNPSWLFTALRIKFIFHIRAPVFLSTFIFSWDSINVPPVIIAYQHLTHSFVPLHIVLSTNPSSPFKTTKSPSLTFFSLSKFHSSTFPLYLVLILIMQFILSYHIY